MVGTATANSNGILLPITSSAFTRMVTGAVTTTCLHLLITIMLRGPGMALIDEGHQ
jgi:hypothetical protein